MTNTGRTQSASVPDDASATTQYRDGERAAGASLEIGALATFVHQRLDIAAETLLRLRGIDPAPQWLRAHDAHFARARIECLDAFLIGEALRIAGLTMTAPTPARTGEHS